MQFIARKRRQTPTVIIVSLIDVLIVVLIFLIVTTTFKQHPNIKLSLPESSESKAGSRENAPLIVTIPKTGALHLGKDPVTAEKLRERLMEAARQNPQVTLAIQADEGAPFGRIVKVMDAAKAANIKTVSAFTKGAGGGK